MNGQKSILTYVGISSKSLSVVVMETDERQLQLCGFVTELTGGFGG